jgi:hypothetical protein
MTPKEIIAGLDSLAADRMSFFDCDDGDDHIFHDDYNALLYAMLELEFREPMPVKMPAPKTYIIDINRFIHLGSCPNCRERITDIMKYCAECGQALLWPEDNKSKQGSDNQCPAQNSSA